MKKFIIELGIFLFLLLIQYSVLSIVLKPRIVESNDYLQAMIDKHDRIASLERPKIIFSGGSNLAFGLHSERVENAFDVPVVNLGMHGGLGLNFMLEELKDVIQSGDIVILSIEYFLSAKGDYALKHEASKSFKDASKYYVRNLKTDIQFHLDQTRENLRSLKYKDAVNSQDGTVYKREYFNQYGDIAADFGHHSNEKLSGSASRDYKYWGGIKKLNKFQVYANSKGVSVFFVYPCFAASEFEKNRSSIEKLAADIRRDLEIEILGGVTDFVFNNAYFLDTVYHLNTKGRPKRTQKMVELIGNSSAAMREIKIAADFRRPGQ